jgi:hypothetical protein
MLTTKLRSAPGSFTNGNSTPISIKRVGPLSSETDDKLQHVCNKLFSVSSSIDQPNSDLIFERICENGLYDREVQCQWMDRSHCSDVLLFLNSLKERLYAALSAMTHALLKPSKWRIWVFYTTESSSEQMRKHQLLLLVNHDRQGVTAVDEAYAIAEITSEDAPRDLRQSGAPDHLFSLFDT